MVTKSPAFDSLPKAPMWRVRSSIPLSARADVPRTIVVHEQLRVQLLRRVAGTNVQFHEGVAGAESPGRNERRLPVGVSRRRAHLDVRCVEQAEEPEVAFAHELLVESVEPANAHSAS